MSLDTLFTEAADAGGPPRFTEDDIARRVDGRRRRRRGLVTGGAVLLVVGITTVGAVLAARGGTSTDDAPATTIADIPVVAASRGSLLGEWEVLVPPEGAESVSEPAFLTFGADGRFQFHVCNSGDGAWTVVDGVLALGVEGREDRACGQQGAWSMSADEALDAGVPTLYEDGLLRIVDEHVTVDLVRADDPTPADPAAPRATADRPLPITSDALAGTWYVSSPPSSTLSFDEDGELRIHDCGSGTASWNIQDGTLSVRDLATEDVDCGFGDRIRLDAAVLGSSTLTEQGLLVFQRSGGAAVLHRQRPEDVEPAPADLALAGTWVRATDEAANVPQASFVELGDRTFRMAVACGTVDGTFEVVGAQLTMTTSGSDLGPACDTFVNDTIVDRAELVDGRLVVHFGPTLGSDAAAITRSFVRLDALAVPSAEELIGRWATGPLLLGGAAMNQVIAFDEEGVADVAACEPFVAWSVDEEGLTITAPDNECLMDFGLDAGETTVDVRLDGEALALVRPDSVVRLQRVGFLADDTPVPDGTTINGPLTSGRRFEVRQSVADGLCAVLAGVDFGCDTSGPVAPVGSFQPRIAVSADAPAPGALLAFGLLPPSATGIRASSPDGTEVPGAVVGSGLWAVPLEGGRAPAAIEYIDDSGTVVQRWGVAAPAG